MLTLLVWFGGIQQVRKLLRVEAQAAVCHQPGKIGHVCNRVLIPGQVGTVGEPQVHHPQHAVVLVEKAPAPVFRLRRRIVHKMPRLPRRRPLVRHLPEQPLHRLVILALFHGYETTGLVPQVQENGGRFRHEQGATLGRRVFQNRDAGIVIHHHEVVFKLCAGADIDLHQFVLEPAFLQHDGRFPAIRGRGKMQSVHL